MNIVISGVNGFVGENLISYLGTGYQVTSVGRSPANSHYQWGALDLIPKDISAYIHLAGKAHDTSNTSKPQEYYQVNTELTKEIFSAFLSSEAEVFIYLSSVKAAADTVKGVLTEEDNPSPLTPYGKSKLEAEIFLNKQVLPPSKRLIILRPSMIHGPGNKGNLNLLYKVVSKGVPYPLASYENYRSFLSVENLCFTIEYIIKNSHFSSGTYFIVDDEPISTNTIVSMIAESIGKRGKMWKLPKFTIRCIAVIGDVIGLPLNSERLKKLTENYVVSNKKLKKELNVEKMPIDAKKGLSKTLKSFDKG